MPYIYNAFIGTPDKNRPADAPIWRYFALEKFLTLLVDSALYLPRLDKLEDAWEGGLQTRARSTPTVRASNRPEGESARVVGRIQTMNST